MGLDQAKVDAPPTSSGGTSTRSPTALDKPRVLVVDDEPQVLVALEDLLSPRFRVLTTNSSEHALELASAHNDLAVVVSDQCMPGMTGDQLFGRLSSTCGAERILVTGFADLTSVINCVNEGRVFAYVTKPWDPDDFQIKVSRAADRYRIIQTLAHERRLLNDLLDNIPDGIYFKDPELRFLKLNAPIARMLNGASPARMVGKRMVELSSGVDARAAEAEEQKIIREGSRIVDEIREYASGVERRWLSETKVPVRAADGSVIGLVGISRDVTDRIEAVRAREHQQQRIDRLTRIHKMLSGINTVIVRAPDETQLLRDACAIAVRDGHLACATVVATDEGSPFRVAAAVAAEEVSGPLLGEVGAQPTWGTSLLRRVASDRAAVVVNDTSCDDDLQLEEEFFAGCHAAVAAFPLIAAGKLEYVFLLSSGQRGFFDSDEERLLTELAENISFALGYIAAKARVNFLAYYDNLTGLPNQSLLLDRLGQQLVTSRSLKRKLALMMLDVDRFRQVNETLGRSGGDALLAQLASRLKEHLDEQDSLARLDGNRFAVMVPLVEDESQVASFVEDLIERVLSTSFEIGDTELLISVSFGISLFPSDGGDAGTLISNAEAALGKAKSQGLQYVFYAPTMNERVAEKLSLETRLRRALDNEEFVLHYQPKVELRQGRVVGLEALIRWQVPGQGLVPPGVFIPVLEETGLIMNVGRWVLMRAAAQHAAWAKEGKHPPRIAVNVSALQLAQPDFSRSLEEVLLQDEAAGRNLELEITESVFVDDLEGNVRKLSIAREHGLRVAIDDFGTGYSSLAYLSRLPIDVLKVDRSFVSKMTRDPQDMALVTTVISLAHSLDCKVVAEGVEQAEQAKLLRLLRCDEMQGYLTGKPLPADEVCELFQRTHEHHWAPEIR